MQPPYLLFLGAETHIGNAKTGAGLAHWRSELCIGQHKLPEGTIDLGLEELELATAVSRGAKTLVIGVAPHGGSIDDSWLPVIFKALECGLNIAAGLHERLNDHPKISCIAKQYNCQLYDVRQPTEKFSVASGDKRSGKRLLTVGSDCAVGKKYSALAIEKEMRARNINADYRATGQTGVFISGGGFSIDAVVADFISGAVETLSPDNDDEHWDIVEGQGSLFHPSYAAVTVGLIHGTQPDVLVLCHDASHTCIQDTPNYPIVEFSECMDGYLAIARLTNKNVYFAGVCVNTSMLSDKEAQEYLENLESKYQLPCCDPVRNGVSNIVDNLGL